MSPKNRSNPLALAVLICLYERPMHPYEVATTLRQRNKHESIRLNYGSLYSVVESLQRRGLVVEQDTQRAGRLPQRTVYALSDAGAIEMHDWLTELVSTPVKDYTSFEAALSFLAALPPDEVLPLLEERAFRLEREIAEATGGRTLVEKQMLPRLFWIEFEFRMVLRRAELGYVRALARDIATGQLDGTQWWRQVHAGDFEPVELPPYANLASFALERGEENPSEQDEPDKEHDEVAGNGREGEGRRPPEGT